MGTAGKDVGECFIPCTYSLPPPYPPPLIFCPLAPHISIHPQHAYTHTDTHTHTNCTHTLSLKTHIHTHTLSLSFSLSAKMLGNVSSRVHTALLPLLFSALLLHTPPYIPNMLTHTHNCTHTLSQTHIHTCIHTLSLLSLSQLSRHVNWVNQKKRKIIAWCTRQDPPSPTNPHARVP